MRRPAAWALAVAIALAAFAAGGPAASGVPGVGAPAHLRVEAIDARTATWKVTGVSTGGKPTISADGKPVDATVTQPPDTDVVVVIDNDRSLGNGTVQLAGQAASQLMPGAAPSVRRLGVVATATAGATQESPLTSSAPEATAAIAGIQQSGDAATWDALDRAARMLRNSDAPSKRVVAFVAAADKLSRNTANSARSALRLSDARLDVVELPLGVDTVALDDMVSQLGGSVAPVGSDDQFAATAAALAKDYGSQFTATFPAPPGDADSVMLDLRAGRATAQAEAVRGAVQVGAAGVTPGANETGLVNRLLSNGLVHWLAVLLLALAVIGFVWSMLSLVVPDDDSLSRRLRAYDESVQEGEGDDEEDGPVGMATVPFLQRAVALTGEVADKRGLLENMETTLERANLPLRAAEAMFFVGVTAAISGLLLFSITKNPFVALFGTALAVMLPKTWLNIRVRRRQKKFVNQLPDMLALLAGTLKAGYSITQGFEAVSREIEDPMGRELRRVVTEHRLGRTLEDALDATSERMGSDDFAWTVMAIKIQREVGGNLAELLMTVANTMTQRERLRRDVASLTAEGRMSALILGLLPPALGLVMYFMNREYIMQLFTPGMGYVMIGAAGIAMAIGFAWMKKIITIEV